MAVLIEEIQQKFEQYAELVDINAKYSFRNPIQALLKCCYRFN